MTKSARADTWLRRGIAISSAPLFLMSLVLMQTGVLLVAAPEALRDEGFRQNLPVGTRVAGLLFFGGTGGMIAWGGWRLIHLARWGLNLAHAMALGVGVSHWKKIFRDGDPSIFNWTWFTICLAIVGYLSVPAVRKLFRDKGRSRSVLAA